MALNLLTMFGDISLKVINCCLNTFQGLNKLILIEIVDKYEEMMGCFAPKKEIQSVDLAPEEAP